MAESTLVEIGVMVRGLAPSCARPSASVDQSPPAPITRMAICWQMDTAGLAVSECKSAADSVAGATPIAASLLCRLADLE